MHSPPPPLPNLDPPAEIREATPEEAARYTRQDDLAREVADVVRKVESAAGEVVREQQNKSAERDAGTTQASEPAAEPRQRPTQDRKPQRKPGR